MAFTYPNTCRICEEWPATQAEGYVCGTCWTRPGAIQFINEPCCQRCGMPFPTESSGPFTCENCRDLSLPFDWARASVRATPFVLDIVHRYKYSGHRWFEPFLIDILSRMVGASVSILEWDVLIPIPLHSVKRRDREFNQAERLATALSKRFGWPVLSEAVVRTLYTESQTHLSRRARVANVKSAFPQVSELPPSGACEL